MKMDKLSRLSRQHIISKDSDYSVELLNNLRFSEPNQEDENGQMKSRKNISRVADECKIHHTGAPGFDN
ncbi:hypothetical protein ACTXT7_002102 [Hymenolepis weldensis]